MKHKRLTRDKGASWGFGGHPYYQARIDRDDFHGLAALIILGEGKPQYWRMPKAGTVCIAGTGIRWLQLIPDGQKRVITAIFLPSGDLSVWYVDVIDHIYTDDDGVIVFVDAYLDVIFSPQGDVAVDDRDELDAAFASGELTQAQYDAAIAEGNAILAQLCGDIAHTEKWSKALLAAFEDQILSGMIPRHPCA